MLALVSGAECRAEPLDEQLLADAEDGRLERFDFVSACLIAGGVPDARDLARWQRRYAAIRQRVRLPASGDQELLARLHRELLAGSYLPDASDLRLAIERGDYNCLSAAAIYWDLCRSDGAELEIWSRPGHVYLRNAATGEKIEPASRAANREHARDETGRLTPPARQITPLQLVGKFYYNRGLQALERGEHSAGIAWIRQSLACDPQDREARANLLAGLNNWAVEHCRQGQMLAARRLIAEGLEIDSSYQPLVANARYLQARSAP